MLPFYEYLAIALMACFILALFSGFPVARATALGWRARMVNLDRDDRIGRRGHTVAELWLPGAEKRDGAGTDRGARSSMAATGFSHGRSRNSGAKGRPSRAAFSARRNRRGWGSTIASIARVARFGIWRR